MKKLIPLILSLALLSGCSQRPGQQEAPPVTTPVAPQTAAPLPETEDTPPPLTEQELHQRVLVRYMEEEKDYLAEGSSELLLSYRCRTPYVELPGLEMNAEQINITLASLAEKFRSGSGEDPGLEDRLSAVAAEYGEYVSQQREYFIPNAYERDCSTVRGDGVVLSFLFEDYFNFGGPHGGTNFSGVSFDPESGRQLSLSDLSADTEGLRALCEREILSQCEGMKEMLYDNYAEYVPDLFSEGNWYLNDSGLVFIANAYTLAPYAAGTLSFTIRYKTLRGLLSERYFLPERDEVQGGLELFSAAEDHSFRGDPLLSLNLDDYGQDILVGSFNTVYNIRLFTVRYDEATGQFYQQDELAYLSSLMDGEHFLLKSSIPDVLPDLQLSWRLPDGSTQRYLISQSGEDGSLLMIDSNTLHRLSPGEVSEDQLDWDLNGDGRSESLSLMKDAVWTLSVNDGYNSFTAMSPFDAERPRFFVADVDEDNCCELFLESGNTVRCWRFTGDLTPVSFILADQTLDRLNATIIDCDVDGLHISCNIPLFGTVLPAHAVLRDGPSGELALAHDSQWEFFTGEGLTLQREISYIRPDGSEGKLPAGARLYPATMDEDSLSFTLESGESGIVAVSVTQE